MKKNDLLPIGSVVLTNKSNKKYIILGTKIINQDKLYDYGCVEYPYGFVKGKDFIYLNKEDLKGLFFLGNIN